ncbi:MAG: hypothetical protein HRT38_18860 [Alteromonadaceae bacterium]|nr:hypothetical protein [Alteromonadaceae bacterium]
MIKIKRINFSMGFGDVNEEKYDKRDKKKIVKGLKVAFIISPPFYLYQIKLKQRHKRK